MTWLAVILLAGAVLGGLRLAGLGGATLQYGGAALLVAVAGYAWQGRPELPGRSATTPTPPAARGDVGELPPGATVDAPRWLAAADRRQRAGDARGAADLLREGLRAHPRDPDLWVGLGNALVIHADGRMSPAAQLAFQRAAGLAPDHAGPRFFAGLALAQAGKVDEAGRAWRELLANAPADAEWRPLVEQRLAELGVAEAAGGSSTRP